MILIDSNALVVLIIGLMDKSQIGKHQKASIYTSKDFENLLQFIGDLKNLVVLPNIWTEVDNLLNRFSGDHRYKYILAIQRMIKETSEVYIESLNAVHNVYFPTLGLTDVLALDLAKTCDYLITGDSTLSDYAKANGIKVYDMVKESQTNS